MSDTLSLSSVSPVSRPSPQAHHGHSFFIDTAQNKTAHHSTLHSSLTFDLTSPHSPHQSTLPHSAPTHHPKVGKHAHMTYTTICDIDILSCTTTTCLPCLPCLPCLCSVLSSPAVSHPVASFSYCNGRPLKPARVYLIAKPP